MKRIGLDIGSTTIKCVVLDSEDKIIYSSYERHLSKIAFMIEKLLRFIKNEYFKDDDLIPVALSGSAGMGLAEKCSFPFIQEVYATRVAVRALHPETDCVIELGGEDAKILFLKNSLEVRMNGSCAGGTGAFIDQMATLLNVKVEALDELAKKHERLYTIASRCGVFAKSDIQPLLNQGAQKEDIAASIFYAVVNQTVAGLAQGREIEGNILYLGGPLTFLEGLRDAFDDVLKVSGTLPSDSLYYVALGTAMLATKPINIDELLTKITEYRNNENFAYQEPLFKSQEEFDEFTKRHNSFKVDTLPLENYHEPCYLGIDSGSTTVKAVLIDEDKNIRYSKYMTNAGNPVGQVVEILKEIYALNPHVLIKGSAVTGYGEDMIKSALNLDSGLVETMAHFEAAKKFKPEVEFVIDIGGQDIKCFKVHNGVISNIFLNEACSSGCGSFLQTFANALGYSIEDFSKLGLFAKRPVNLGSRCTVFMNSAVKQAQKDGATIEDISAGLSISVVKNALYKVIRASSKEELGTKIVVQGGTFLNAAVLRAFELELGFDVVRANIAGLMGAYGAALHAQDLELAESTVIKAADLVSFKHDIKSLICQGCPNHCRLTVNTFNGSRKFIGGNKCDRPITNGVFDESLDLYSYKQKLLDSYKATGGIRGTIGIPFALNMYELYPFWWRFFTELGFEVVRSDVSSKDLYSEGQMTIPSDTICFPAKLVHGHIQNLIDKGIKTIFYPCMTYNVNEHKGDNNYNCPVVAYYPEVIDNNMKSLLNNQVVFIKDYLGLHRPHDFALKAFNVLKRYGLDVTLNEVKGATKKAYNELHSFHQIIEERGLEIVSEARKNHKTIIVLAGRPYHIDPLINHSINRLLDGFNVAIITEDVLAPLQDKVNVHVLNQWTYHSRLYLAAEYITKQPDMELIQMVSFGCGVDAITTDEVRDILEKKNKIYTQIKIDEITNLGAIKIRIRSLLSAIERRKHGK